MSKTLEIELVDPDFEPLYWVHKEQYPVLHEIDCTNILDKLKGTIGTEISHKDVELAIDILIDHFVKNGLYKMAVDISERDRLAVPPKEMTMEDIEKALGYKIKIISEKGERE